MTTHGTASTRPQSWDRNIDQIEATEETHISGFFESKFFLSVQS